MTPRAALSRHSGIQFAAGSPWLSAPSRSAAPTSVAATALEVDQVMCREDAPPS